MYLAFMASDEDEDGHRHHHRGQCRHHDDYYCDEPGISFPKAQVGFGLSYFVSSDLAVGGRYI